MTQIIKETLVLLDKKTMLKWFDDNSREAVAMIKHKFAKAKAIWAVGGTVLSCLR